MKLVKKYLTPDGPIQQLEPVLLKKRHGLWWHMMHPIRKRLYNNIGPYKYHNFDSKSNGFKRVWNAVVRNKPDEFRLQMHKYNEPYKVKDALWAKYLNLDDEDVGYKISDYVEESPYTYNGHKAYRLKPETAFTLTTPLYTEWYSLDAILNPNETNYGTYNSADLKGKGNYYDKNLGRYDYGRTSDYVWYHDKWDLNPYKGLLSVLNTKDLKLQDRHTKKPIKDIDQFYTALALGMSERKFRRMRRKYGSEWVNQLVKDKGVDLWDNVLSKELGEDFEYRKKWRFKDLFKGFGDFSFGIGKPFHLYDRYYMDE